MAVILEAGRLTLTGDVGDFGMFDHFSHSDVVVALAGIEDDEDLTVHLNSGGGYASEGAAIYALLSRRAGNTSVVVDGVAASAASLIAMAGDTVTMSAGSVLMIHEPAAFTMGNAEEHTKTIEGLEALATSYARVYAAKSGKTADECRAIMKAERWFTPDEAVAEGFADETSEARAKPVAAFDYRAYAHAPQRLVALASKKNWRLPSADKAALSAAAPGQSQEHSMTDKERADKLAAELDELKAKMKASNDAEATAALQQELEQLRAEKAARDNADAIMALDEAKGREAQAKALADAGVKAEQAKVILAAAPKAEQKPGDKTYMQRKTEDGALGLGAPDPSGRPNAPTMADNMRKLIGQEAK